MSEQALATFKKLIENQKKAFTDDEVLKLSEDLGKHFASAVGRDKKENSRTQIRKFFGLVKVAQGTAEASDSSADTIKVKLRVLQAQVTYATARKIISEDFKALFDASINNIISTGTSKEALQKSITSFATFFEALYAYFYYHTESRKRSAT